MIDSQLPESALTKMWPKCALISWLLNMPIIIIMKIDDR